MDTKANTNNNIIDGKNLALTVNDLYERLCALERALERVPPPIPVGTILSFAGDIPPDGWLLCDGRGYQVHDYPNLSQLIRARFLLPGTLDAFFNVPDLRGRTVFGVHHDVVGILNPRTHYDVGATGGSETHFNHVNALQCLPHDHEWLFRQNADWCAPRVAHAGADVGSKVFSGRAGGDTRNTTEHQAHNHQDAVLGGWGANGTHWYTSEAGGTLPEHDTQEAAHIPPFVALNFIIKV